MTVYILEALGQKFASQPLVLENHFDYDASTLTISSHYAGIDICFPQSLDTRTVPLMILDLTLVWDCTMYSIALETVL